tara:strand:+ start:236 stop:649 length:414 start_codon:yes stop_codon:yes gene_type:complete
METNTNNSSNIIDAATCLLLAVSHADNILNENEEKIIKDILIDFFNIDKKTANEYFRKNNNKIKKSTDLYEFAKILNSELTHQDKIDFIYCTYEVAYIDNDSHYLEEHIIKKISYILNIDKEDLIKSKNSMKDFFKL